MDTDQPTAPILAVPAAEAAASAPAPESEAPKLKYWQQKAGIAPIKSE